MLIAAVLFITVIGIIFLFTSKTLSPIPYFPSNAKDMPHILRGLNLRNDQTIIDLGAGDGTIIIAAADEALKKNLNTEFVGSEINPILYAVLLIRKWSHPSRNRIHILFGDMFKRDFGPYLRRKHTTWFYYISPAFVPPVTAMIKKLVQKPEIVTYFYPIKAEKEKQLIQGVNKTFVYTLRA